jgi:5-formyltetrahydrofolate cyclo-ligase
MSDTRSALRQRLLQDRLGWATQAAAAAAQTQLAQHLAALLEELEPECLGLYWPIQGEFNPREVALDWFHEMKDAGGGSLALPWASKGSSEGKGREPAMAYRRWDGSEPTTRDECGIPCPDTAPAQPDVVLVPCVGFTRSGFRLGYGGGYFDRYMARHPDVTAVGLAWSQAEISEEAFAAQAHDQPLMIILTPEGVVD